MTRTGAGWTRALLAVLALSAPWLAAPARATFSIVAYDSLTHELGVAVQSRAFSVGIDRKSVV